MDYDDTFESGDSGASLTYPCSCGDIKKGGFMCIGGRPCRVKHLIKYRLLIIQLQKPVSTVMLEPQLLPSIFSLKRKSRTLCQVPTTSMSHILKELSILF